MVNASPLLLYSFIALAAIVAGAFVVAVSRSTLETLGVPTLARRAALIAAAGTGVWLAATAALAARGALSFASRPPTMIVLLVAIFVIAIAVATSRTGERLATGIPLAALVGVQGFRFPLELLLHRAYTEGLMPVQMSFSGRNFDILTGLSAIAVGTYLARKPRALAVARVWNAVGVILLANILTIAMLSAPTPFRVFHNEPANVWVTRAPWVWLPSVFVLAAILGHLLVFRRLRYESRARAAAPGGGGPMSTAPHPALE